MYEKLKESISDRIGILESFTMFDSKGRSMGFGLSAEIEVLKWVLNEIEDLEGDEDDD